MTPLLIAVLVAWLASIVFLVVQIYRAPHGKEDAKGFHLISDRDDRWPHLSVHHPRRSHRSPRQVFHPVT